MKLGELIKEWVKSLSPMFGERESEAITREAFGYFLNYSKIDMALKKDTILSDYQQKIMGEAMERLLKGEPIQYVTGEAWFHGLRLKVNPSVLIPRPETSQLVDIIEKEWKSSDHLSAIDLCTGSGAIALALSNDLDCDNVTAVEISPKALQIAKVNGKKLNLTINWREGNVLNPSDLPDGIWDIIVSNPPYIPDNERDEVDKNVLEFEPSQALFVPDDDPLKFYVAIAEWGREHLKENGKIYFEINPHFSKVLKEIMRSKGYKNVRTERDINGRERFFIAGR